MTLESEENYLNTDSYPRAVWRGYFPQKMPSLFSFKKEEMILFRKNMNTWYHLAKSTMYSNGQQIIFSMVFFGWFTEINRW